jgi:MFS family permease
MTRTFTTNIYSLYLIKLSKWLMLIMPIVALFYTDNGLDTFDIYVLQAVYSISVALLEIPSGYMADVIGRKKSLVIGKCLKFPAIDNFFRTVEIFLGEIESFLPRQLWVLIFQVFCCSRVFECFPAFNLLRWKPFFPVFMTTSDNPERQTDPAMK